MQKKKGSQDKSGSDWDELDDLLKQVDEIEAKSKVVSGQLAEDDDDAFDHDDDDDISAGQPPAPVHPSKGLPMALFSPKDETLDDVGTDLLACPIREILSVHVQMSLSWLLLPFTPPCQRP